MLICDTAGRLHNKKNLMDELRKIDKIITREFPDAYRENLIVLDGTTGQNALAQAKQFHFDEAKQKIAEAEECIHQAHVAQTEVIQNETRGKTYEPCLLFAHAQDTLMTIMSELNLAKELIAFFEIMNKKIEEK